jgi:hypothetical protein
MTVARNQKELKSHLSSKEELLLGSGVLYCKLIGFK